MVNLYARSLLACFLLLLSYRLLLAQANGPAPEDKGQKPDPKAQAPRTVEQVLDWLPATTETAFVARGPFAVKAEQIKERDVPLEKVLEAWSLGLLSQIGQGRYAKELNGQVVALAVEGARGFRGPNGLGLMPFDGCHILVFQRDLGSAGAALMKALKDGTAKAQRLAGHEVLVVEEKLEKDLWKIFVTRPRPDVLLCATEENYLREVLERMQHKREPRALPASLPEWKHVDQKARFWAVRHYDKDNAKQDPTSPLTTQKRAYNNPDPQAVGLTFSFEPGRGAQPKVRYLSANKDALRIAAWSWTAPGGMVELRPGVRQIEPEVVEIAIDVKDSNTLGLYLLLLLGALGHGVYI